MSQLRDLVAKLRLDTAPFKAGLRGPRIKAAGVASCLCAALLLVAGALTAPLCAATLWRGVRHGVPVIDALAKSAWDRIGSIGGFRALKLAAGGAGVAVGTLSKHVQNMRARLSPASPMAPWVRVGGLDGRSGLAAMPHPNESPFDQMRGQGEAARVLQPGIVQDSVGATYRALREVKPQ